MKTSKSHFEPLFREYEFICNICGAKVTTNLLIDPLHFMEKLKQEGWRIEAAGVFVTAWCPRCAANPKAKIKANHQPWEPDET
jgi:hypothetical protein